MPGFDYLRRHPDEACTFDDATTVLSSLSASTIATTYDFGWRGTLMDIGVGQAAVRFGSSASRNRNCVCRLCRVRSVAVDYLRDLPWWVCLGLASFTRKIASHGKDPDAKVADLSICSLCRVHILNSDSPKDTYTAASGNAHNVGVVSC
jgi:hypothetical protein